MMLGERYLTECLPFLIELYHQHLVLHNIMDDNYFNRDKRAEVLRKLSEGLGGSKSGESQLYKTDKRTTKKGIGHLINNCILYIRIWIYMNNKTNVQIIATQRSRSNTSPCCVKTPKALAG